MPKKKFVPISNKKDSNTFIMPGRQKCECAATKHELINNCISCGRIVCGQEGAGPCWHCGDLVCSNEDFQKISSKSNKSQTLFKQLMNNNWPHHNTKEYIDEALPKFNYEDSNVANERKERLLEFDRTSARRTKVIDDEKDYYRTEGKLWMDPKSRDILKRKEQELRDKRFTPRHARPLKYSIEKGQLIEEKPTNEAAYELFEEPEIEFANSTNYVIPTEPNLNSDFLNFISPLQNQTKNTKKTETNNCKSMSRLQDRELHEIRDEGMCLSMHQPWASFLVLGIKKHEGRSWYTNHRGRLWIAATAKVPSVEDIYEVKQNYLNRTTDRRLFPESYPVGCILGCVDVVDCLPEEEYLERYPNGESGSPFVFICENPRELSLKFPLKGKHKIYKLEHHVHMAAKSGIGREE